MIKRHKHKALILIITAIFTMVNLSVVSNVFCSMKDMSSCCCKQKTVKKSCCDNKNVPRYTSNCVCEIKESNTDPAELLQNFTLSSSSKILKVFTSGETLFSMNENVKVCPNSLITTFHSPPNEDINTFKCVLRI